MQKKYALSVIISIIVYLFVYTFIHEMGHGLIGVFAGGHIDRLVLGLNARVYISNAEYNRFSLPLMNIMGMLLPYFVFLVISVFYNKNNKYILYKVFHGIFVFGILGSMIPWVVIPIVSIFTIPPSGDDVTNFLNNSGLNPIIITIIGLLLFGLFLFVALKKEIINNFINVIKSLRNCSKTST